MIGSLTGSTIYTAGSIIGTYNINYSSGTLTSALGYGFSYTNNTSGITVRSTASAIACQLIYSFNNPGE